MRMSDIIPSERQLDIFTTWNTGQTNILTNAVAGSGKTTTLLKLLSFCSEKTLFLAFNKSVKEEIQSKIDERGLTQGKAMTLHSLGFMAVRNAYRRTSVKKGKNYDLLKKLQSNNSRLFKNLSWKEKVKFGYTLMDMNDISRLFLTNDISKISTHFSSMDKTMYETDDLPRLWQEFIELREESYTKEIVDIDYIDMIYIPVYKSLAIPIDPSYLMIDEAQDLNLSQHGLIDLLLSQGDVKKWIAVGDRNQAIYGFSGAYASSFNLFLDKGSVVELPLDICYRCDNLIVDAANEVYPVMAYSNAVPGIVAIENDPSLIKENSMVICRNSGPLLDLYFQLLGLGKDAFLKGDDILNSIIRFLTPYKYTSVHSAKFDMDMKLIQMAKKDGDNDRMAHYIFKENLGNFKKLATHFCKENETVDTLLSRLKSIFIDKENAIMLCTIHKSKGLESDVVYILDEKLIPSKFTRSSEQLAQEQNLKYVARTRAKHELYYLNIEKHK